MRDQLDEDIIKEIRRINEGGEPAIISRLYDKFRQVSQLTIWRHINSLIERKDIYNVYDTINGRVHNLLYADDPRKCMTRAQADEMNKRLERIENAVCKPSNNESRLPKLETKEAE